MPSATPIAAPMPDTISVFQKLLTVDALSSM